MNVREYLLRRRQRKARRLYEQEKARRDAASDPKALDRVNSRARGMDFMGGGGWPGGSGGGG